MIKNKNENLIPNSRNLNFDVEANGLLSDVTKVWCVVAQDEDTEELFVFHNFPQFDFARVTDNHDGKEYIIPKRNGSLEEGVRFLMKEGKKLICHNFFGYDYFLLKRFFPFFKFPLRDCVDTLVLSKLQWFDRPTPKGCRGPHGLAAWGTRIGISKPEVSDWTVMDAFKLHRCIEDVKIQTQTTKLLRKERLDIEKLVGASLDEAIRTEHRYRFEATRQEITGAPVDVEHMKECLEELDKYCTELREKIEPQLPYILKYKAVMETEHAVAKSLGAKNPPPIKYNREIVDGEAVKVPIKKYYKPVVRYCSVDKVTKYSAINIEKGIDTGFKFDKLKEAREYSKEIGGNGWKFPKEIVETTLYNAVTCNHFDLEPEDYQNNRIVDGPYTRVTFTKATMAQHAVVKDFLTKLGWKPTEWNYKKDAKGQLLRDEKGKLIASSPKLTEDSFKSLPAGVGKDIADYNTYTHRRKFIENPADGEKGLLNLVREDGRISCGINCFGTSTGRS